MSVFLSPLIPLVTLVIGFGFISIIVWWIKWTEVRHPRQSPLSNNLLRPAGYGLRCKIEEFELQIQALVAVICLLPALVYSVHVSQSYFGNVPESPFRLAVAIGSMLVGLPLVCWPLAHFVRKRKLYTLGMEGELATAQELNQLMLDGCRVFHDIEFPHGNIDHVVVSISGVYSINTKIVGKSKQGGSAKVTVDHHRNVIRFPHSDYPIPTGQLEGEARWLSQELSGALDEKIQVESILALPGWFIEERIGRGPVYVINPVKPAKFFVSARELLSEQTVCRIAHHLEKKCRNIEPGYRQKSSF